MGEFKYDNYGGKARLSIWEPEVSPTQISSASMLVATGTYERFESIRAGWIVSQNLVFFFDFYEIALIKLH